MIAASAFPLGDNAQFGSKPSKANRLLGFEQPAADGCNSATGKPASTKNLNNLLADDGDDGKASQGEQPGLIQQLLNFFFSKLWSPATSDAEKLGWTYVYAEDSSLLAEYGEGSAATSGSAQYLWLPTANGPMPIAAVVNGQTYAVHSDHLNTPRKLTQANGQAVWQWAYSAFGDEQPTTAAKRFTSEMTVPTTGATSIPDVTFNLRYPGQYFDKETGLHYNYFRTYAPGTGRYTQPDPIGLDGGWNRFGYVSGNPLRYSDPRGLNPFAGAWAGAGAGSVFGPMGTVVGGIIGAGAGAWIGWNIVGPMFNEGDGESKDPVVYPNNPDVAPDQFENIPRTPGKYCPTDGSVWERDTAGHGNRDGEGSQWKRWPNKRDWSKGKTPNSIWPDGRIRK